MASICFAVASPGGSPSRLSESVTMAWPATLWLATELSSQRRKRLSSRAFVSSGGLSASTS